MFVVETHPQLSIKPPRILHLFDLWLFAQSPSNRTCRRFICDLLHLLDLRLCAELPSSRTSCCFACDLRSPPRDCMPTSVRPVVVVPPAVSHMRHCLCTGVRLCHLHTHTHTLMHACTHTHTCPENCGVPLCAHAAAPAAGGARHDQCAPPHPAHHPVHRHPAAPRVRLQEVRPKDRSNRVTCPACACLRWPVVKPAACALLALERAGAQTPVGKTCARNRGRGRCLYMHMQAHVPVCELHGDAARAGGDGGGRGVAGRRGAAAAWLL